MLEVEANGGVIPDHIRAMFQAAQVRSTVRSEARGNEIESVSAADALKNWPCAAGEAGQARCGGSRGWRYCHAGA